MQILLITNGIKLLDQPEEFWIACRENQITVTPTKYPINVDYDAIMERARSYQVKCDFFGIDRETFYKRAFDPEGKQNVTRSFFNCPHLCNALAHGRLYPCGSPVIIEHLNHRFGTNFESSSKDSIDIYQDISQKEVLKFLARPIPFCRYCMGTVGTVPWSHSKKDIKEWTL